MLTRSFIRGLIFATLLSRIMFASTAMIIDARLADAAMNGDRDAVRALLKQKVDVNAPQGDGTTALHWAVFRDDLEMAKLLLESGANLKATTRNGALTPLIMA